MTRKNVKNIKMHSKRTGAIILAVLGFLVIGGSIFMYFADLENKQFEIELDKFQALSCDDMQSNASESWQKQVFLNRVYAGECGADNVQIISFDSCANLFDNLEKETDPDKRQTIHAKIKEAGC